VTTANAQRNNRVALITAIIALSALGMAFAAVPLYGAFCQLTGWDGTPIRAKSAPGAVAGQIGVRFDANVHPGLPWKFEPVQRTVRIAPGARTQIFYRATNLSSRTITAQAVYNVTPDTVGEYFDKIECFCFKQQTLGPGETALMPVVFFVSPKIRDDEDTRTVDEITLSYTFYPVESGASGR
jgi:cytochrome c oxidase assembly protein subunit 11